MFFMSGSQAHAFAAAAQTMTGRVRAIGPNPLKLSENGRPARQTAEPRGEEEVGFRGRRT